MHRRRSRNSIFGDRPLWRNYYLAICLVVFGFMLSDVASAPPHNRAVEIVAAAIFLMGLLVFLIALASSVYFGIIGKEPRNGSNN
jgi:cytochrome c oxidase assembly factor CtaG